MLEDERYIELHVKYGKYFRVRMPEFGRDMAYHAPNAELIIAASGYEIVSDINKRGVFLQMCSSDIYRLNLELGRFMQPLTSEALSTTCCAVNEQHGLVVTGTVDVSCYDCALVLSISVNFLVPCRVVGYALARLRSTTRLRRVVQRTRPARRCARAAYRGLACDEPCLARRYAFGCRHQSRLVT